jgi:hypothetical protein
MMFVVSELPQGMALAHYKARNSIEPPILVLPAFLLICGAEQGVVVNDGMEMGVKPFRAPIALKHSHPSDLSLAHCNRGEQARAQYDSPVEHSGDELK